MLTDLDTLRSLIRLRTAVNGAIDALECPELYPETTPLPDHLNPAAYFLGDFSITDTSLIPKPDDNDFSTPVRTGRNNTPLASQSFPARGRVHSEPQRHCALGTADSQTSAASTIPQTVRLVGTCNESQTHPAASPNRPNTCAQPVTDTMTTGSPSVLT